ncbi:MAG TPA: hypothetical protein VML75_18965 [Kofleriaceae bacterium]|nr:hypothetical protein [Kofleriaceae bacterium]
MTLRVLVCAWLGLLLVTAHAHAQPRPRGRYEAEALTQALEALHLEEEPAPEGKLLDRIWVVNLEVFGPRTGFLRWFNVFHRTTRWRQIEREVILRPGELWDQGKLQETERKLRDPLFSSQVVVVPVKSPHPGRVDLLVVTRDVWSMRFNSRFEIQEQSFTKLTLSISENNLLGARKQLALVFDMDQSDVFVGPLYVDKNIAGTRLQLRAYGGPLFSRETGELEGSQSSTTFQYPLWSLQRTWAAGISVVHFDGVVRDFIGTDLRTYDDPSSAEVEEVPWRYEQRNVDIETSVTRSFGKEVLYRVSAGHDLHVQRPAVPDDFAFPEAVRDAFVRDVFPRSERTSSLFARLNVFTPRYVAYRDISTYDLSEDARLGPEATVTAGAALEAIGAETNFLFASASSSYTQDLRGDGFARVATAASMRLQDGELIDNRLDLVAKVVTPRIADLLRVAAQLQVGRRLNEQQNRFFTVGGDDGLRGYRIRAFNGQARVLGNVELRSMPIAIWFARAGAIAFWDVGHAAETFSDLGFRHDVGAGIRWLLPQLSPLVYRLDWAVPLTGSGRGFPGRIIFGVDQVF